MTRIRSGEAFELLAIVWALALTPYACLAETCGGESANDGSGGAEAPPYCPPRCAPVWERTDVGPVVVACTCPP